MRTATLPLLLALAAPAFGAQAKVLLLNGFEPDVVKAWFAKHPVKRIGYSGPAFWDKDGKVYKREDAVYGGGTGAPCVKGDATQGEWALVREIPGRGRWTLGFLKNPKTIDSIRRMQGRLLCHAGAFRWYYPKDWSGYAKFRADVKCAGSPMRLQITLEDAMSISYLMLRRVFDVPPDKWVTVEIDLAELAKLREVALPEAEAKRLGVKALKGRLLNLEEMANIWMGIERVKAKCAVKLDNLRLVTADAAKADAKLLVLTDPRPYPVPQHLPPSQPTPRDALKCKLNTAPIKWEEPVFIPGVKYAYDVAVVDNNRMLMAVGTTAVLKTIDGGKTWTGLDGKANKPTRVIDHDTNAPGRTASALGPDVMVLGVAKCSGGGTAVESYSFLTKFDGTGWRAQPRGLVDVDVRHCPEWKVRVVRLPSGRIWACWLHRSRFGTNDLFARYSDDGGATWRSPTSNGLVRLGTRGKTNPYGMTWWVEEPPMRPSALAHALGRVCPMTHTRPEIAAWGEHVMCVFQSRWDRLGMAFFDGTKWTVRPDIGMGRTGVVSLANFEGRTVYLATSAGKVYRLDGERWVEETPPGMKTKGRLPYPGHPSVRLSAAGNVMVCSWTDDKRILVSQKPKGGGWSKPREVCSEENGILQLSAPVRSVENFVPVVWTIPGATGGARFVRIPVQQPQRSQRTQRE